MRVSHEVTEMFRTPAGGWTKKQLAEWGVNWPPMRGWRKRLDAGLDPNIPDGPKPGKTSKERVAAKAALNLPAWNYAPEGDSEAERLAMKKLYQEKSGDHSY